MRKLTKEKSVLLVVCALVAINLTGCKVPTNADGTIKLIELSTGFKDLMSSESWFSAIFVWPMAQFLNKFGPTLGVAAAIGLLTLLVNVILLAFTMKSTIATQQMQLLQPEMEKIQRKYEGKDDQTSKMRMAAEMQALYKKYNVNPFSMMLVQFIQFPVIIAMYQAVQRSYFVKHATLMGLSLEVSPFEGLKQAQYAYLIIFGIMALAQYFSMTLPQKYAEKRAQEEAEKHHRRVEKSAASSQQKMMQWYMLAMILIFGLMWPTAMSIYWIFFSLVNILKTLLVQKKIEKMREEQGGNR